MTDPNGNQHRFGGPWTEIKLGVLERYLSAYATALKKQHFKLLYIDAFAGSGEYTPAGVPDAKDGSATIALQTDGLHRYCFIEKDQSHFSQLQKLRERFPSKSIELLQGDANAILPLLLAELDARHWRGFQPVTESPGARDEVCQGHPGQGTVMVPTEAAVPLTSDNRRWWLTD